MTPVETCAAVGLSITLMLGNASADRCFTDRALCEIDADGANFALDTVFAGQPMSHKLAYCQYQPVDDPAWLKKIKQRRKTP